MFCPIVFVFLWRQSVSVAEVLSFLSIAILMTLPCITGVDTASLA